MSADLLTLPRDIPGLLRRGSPVLLNAPEHHLHGRSGVVGAVANGKAAVLFAGCEMAALCTLGQLALDLSDPTGQTHLAWWVESHIAARVTEAREAAGVSAPRLAYLLCWMKDGGCEAADVAEVRRVALVLAGREVSA